MRHRNEPLDVAGEVDDDAGLVYPAHRALDLRPRRVLLREALPRVLHRLLDAQRDTVPVLVDAQHHHLDLLASVENLARVLDPLRPGHVGNVDQAVHALFELDERAEVCEVPDASLDPRSHRVLAVEVLPRVALGSLEGQ